MGPLRIFILVLGCRRSSISTHKSVKAVVAREQSRCMQRRRHTLRTTDTPTHHAQWEAIAHDRASRRKHLATQKGGGRTPRTGAAQTPYTSALARCVRRPPLSYRLLNGGVRPRAAPSRSRRETSEPHAMRACAMAPRLRPIDEDVSVRQPPFLYLDHVQAVGGRARRRAVGGESVRR